jgi:membrane-bound metal-dependent hydrolase YbcI (DUF457 family)
VPITPFHFGPGALVSALAPAWISWTVFVLANCVIDLEPVSLFLLTGDPAHRFLHTLPGATLVAAVCAIWGRPLGQLLLGWWNRQLSVVQARWLATGSHISARQAWGGALAGSWSHLLLDSFMHDDVQALWPLLSGNPLWRSIPLDVLHLGCAAAGVIAVCVILFVRWRSLRRD